MRQLSGDRYLRLRGNTYVTEARTGNLIHKRGSCGDHVTSQSIAEWIRLDFRSAWNLEADARPNPNPLEVAILNEAFMNVV